MGFFHKPLLVFLLSLSVQTPAASAVESAPVTPKETTLSSAHTTPTTASKHTLVSYHVLSDITQDAYGLNDKEQHHDASGAFQRAVYDDIMTHPAWKSNHKTNDSTSEPKSTPATNKTHNSEETDSELSAWKDWTVDGVKQLYAQPISTVFKVINAVVVSVVELVLWTVFRLLEAIAIIKKHSVIAYHTACSSVTYILDLAVNATITMANSVGNMMGQTINAAFTAMDPVTSAAVTMAANVGTHLDYACHVVFNPILRDVIVVCIELWLLRCACSFQWLVCILCPSEWSTIPGRVLSTFHVICLPSLFMALSSLVNLEGKIPDDQRLPRFIFCSVPAMLSLAAALAKPHVMKKIQEARDEKERIKAEQFGIEHLRRIFSSMESSAQRDHLPTFLKVFATVPCTPTNETMARLWGSMALCAATVGTVDEGTCQDVVHLMGEDAKKCPAFELLKLVRVEPAFGTPRQRMFKRSVHGADWDHWQSHRQTRIQQETGSMYLRVLSWAV